MVSLELEIIGRSISIENMNVCRGTTRNFEGQRSDGNVKAPSGRF